MEVETVALALVGPLTLRVLSLTLSVVSKPKTRRSEDPFRKRRPTTKTKTHYENEDPLFFNQTGNEKQIE